MESKSKKRKRYENEYPKRKGRTLKDVFNWLCSRKIGHWPENINFQPQKAFPERVDKGALQATFVNHSTVLIQIDEVNIITDPIWSERCSPFTFTGPKRLAPPGVNFDDLPQIDIVLLSHNHYDHADLPTLKKLFKKHRPLFCVPRGVSRWLQKKGLRNVIEFDWWHEETINDHLKIAFVPAQHFSRRGLFDSNKTLWGGFVILGSPPPVYFAGDTAYGDHFKMIRHKYGPPALALLPIGSYLPRMFMQAVHMSPEDAVKAHLDLKAGRSIGIHFGTFKMGDEGYEDPIRDLRKALDELSVPHSQFITLVHGQTIPIF